MMTPARMVVWIAMLILPVAVTGCATPPAVRQLAERTGGNVSLINTQLQMLVRESRRIAEVRAANVGRLQADVSEVKLRYDIDVEVMQRTGEGERISQAKELREFVEKLVKLQDDAARAAREREARVIARYQALAIPSKQLNEITSELVILGKDEDVTARVKFISAYAESVAAEVKARQKQKEQASNTAKAEAEGNAKKDPAGKADTDR